MYFLKLVPIFLAALVAAQDDGNGNENVIFTGFNYGGKTHIIPTKTSCTTLVPPFKYHVSSLKVADGVHCEIFAGNGCNNLLDDVTESNPQVEDWFRVASIRCAEF